MESFNDLLTKWQPFFSAVASAAATLAGLLFVSLSLNRERITAGENEILLRLARRTFGDFLYPLFIALIFLGPHHHAYGVAAPLFLLAVYWAWKLGLSMVRLAKAGGVRASGGGMAREFAFHALACVGLLVASVEIWRENMTAIFLLVPVICLMLANASLNAWQLLMIERKERE